MRTRSLVALTLGVVLFVAGCIDPTSKDVLDGEAPTADERLKPFVNPIVLEHDHKDLSEHQLQNNMDLVGRDPMGENGPPGGPGEIDLQGHYAYVALLGYGFAIVDIEDPENPKTVSTTQFSEPLGTYAADLKVDKTGNWVFLALELSTVPGVLIYDATDKTAPRLAGVWAEPGKFAGCHMIEYAEIDGQEYLFCAPLDAAIYVGLISPPTPSGQREIVQVARWSPATPKFLQWVASNPAQHSQDYGLSGHDDMTFQIDPITKAPTLFVSFWQMGVWFLDVTIPAAPLALGSWFGEGADLYAGQIHTTMMFQDDAGRRIVVAIPEVARYPAVFVLDATDFENPKVLAEWMAVDDWGPHYGTFSTHNFQIVDQRMYLAHYHGAIWVLDLSTPETPTPIGSYQPNEPRADGNPYEVGSWDVVVWNGYTITADSNGGFYVLHFALDPAGDEAHTSFA